MKTILFLLFLLLSLALMLGCQTSLVKVDGEVDQMEAGLIMVIADAAMAANPDSVSDAYRTTGTILERMTYPEWSDEVLTADLIRSRAIEAGVLPEQAETLVTIAYGMRAALIAKLGEEKALLVLNNGAVVNDIIRIVNDQAGKRLKAREG